MKQSNCKISYEHTSTKQTHSFTLPNKKRKERKEKRKKERKKRFGRKNPKEGFHNVN